MTKPCDLSAIEASDVSDALPETSDGARGGNRTRNPCFTNPAQGELPEGNEEGQSGTSDAETESYGDVEEFPGLW